MYKPQNNIIAYSRVLLQKGITIDQYIYLYIYIYVRVSVSV